MPAQQLRRTSVDGKPAYQVGTGKKYPYKAGDPASRESAKVLAMRAAKRTKTSNSARQTAAKKKAAAKGK